MIALNKQLSVLVKEADAMVSKYGEEKLDELIDKSRSLAKLMPHELLELIEDFKERIKNLKK